MKWGLALFGLLGGAYIGSAGSAVLGMAVGLFAALLVAETRDLRRRLEALERRDGRPEDTAGPSAAADRPSTTAAPAPTTPASTTQTPTTQTLAPPSPVARAARTAGTTDTGRADSAPQEATASPWARPDDGASPSAPGLLDRGVALAREWLTTGNVPVKLGVLISFFGVAFLLKYAVDRRLISFPIELRLLAVAAAAIALLVTGWRLRARTRVYALSLQGGGIGILYLTIFAAFRLYDLVPAPAAFALLVALTAFAGFVAVLQDARALAALGIVGGFLAPVLVSTGAGNHVALFSYYLILNGAILGIAFFKAWRELNLLGFLFTFVIGTLWGERYYRPELFWSVEPFLIAHFLLYQAVAVLFALRSPLRLGGLVDGTIVFGTPVITFALQSYLVEFAELGLAVSAAVVALFYAGLATWLWRRHRATLRLMTESYLALAVAFATLAIPLALDARWTSAAWALEGAALMWVGTRQERWLPRLAGGVLLFLAGLAFLEAGWDSGAGIALLNGNFLGGLLIAVASLFSARLLSRGTVVASWQPWASQALFAYGALWWLATGTTEIDDRVEGANGFHLFTLFIAASAYLCTRLATALNWRSAHAATLAYLPLLVVAGLLYLMNDTHPWTSWGLLAWLAAGAVQLAILRDLDVWSDRIAGYVHVATVLALALLLGWELHWVTTAAGLSEVWAGAAALLAPTGITASILRADGHLDWPVGRQRTPYLFAALLLIAGGLFLLLLLVVASPGQATPLPYVPLLNPFDAVTGLMLATAAWLLLRLGQRFDLLLSDQRRQAWIGLGAAAFMLTTVAVARGVAQLDDVPWRGDALFGAVTVQAALSIYWGLLGVLGMVFGARWARRLLWQAGAVLMGLVVLKLFVVDLGNTETVARIVSFIGVGALLLLVGYYAPAPPTDAKEDES